MLLYWLQFSQVILLVAAIEAQQPTKNCGKMKLFGPHGFISSPNYPHPYANDTNCVWYINVAPGNIITISFSDLDIEEDADCSEQPCCKSNWLSLPGEQDGELFHLCGRGEIPPPITSQAKKIVIKFHTSQVTSHGRGFQLSYLIGPETQRNCSPGEFQCYNGKCILKHWVCNKWDECGDNSDEKDCKEVCVTPHSTSCGGDKISCYDKETQQCNGVWDCVNGADEQGCQNCKHDQFACKLHGGCYTRHQMCDGTMDCHDFSDEMHCGFCQGNLTKCGPNSDDCFNPFTQRCDGKLDCTNAFDEHNCFTNCQNKIMCNHHKGCYTLSQRCNALKDCTDSSDEENCTPILCNAQRNGFLCANGDCILNMLRCDRVDDCGDGSDEIHCLRNSMITAAVMGSLICSLLLVLVVGCTCKLCNLHCTGQRGLHLSTPLFNLEEEFFQREPPPPYSVSVTEPTGSTSQPRVAFSDSVPHVHRHPRRPHRSRRRHHQPLLCNEPSISVVPDLCLPAGASTASTSGSSTPLAASPLFTSTSHLVRKDSLVESGNVSSSITVAADATSCVSAECVPSPAVSVHSDFKEDSDTELLLL